MANPLLAFSIIIGLIVGLLIYKRKKNYWYGLLGFVLTSAGIGTPLHCIIFPGIAGVFINKWLYKQNKKNWLSFLISLLGIILIVLMLLVTGRLYINIEQEGFFGLGEAIGTGIAIGIAYAFFIIGGVVSYVSAIIVMSIIRGIKKRKVK